MSGKKIVLKLNINDNETKKKALKAVSGLQGIDSVSMDMKEKKMTVIGEADPVEVVTKLKKKKLHVEIVTVGPAKEPEKKKEEPKKEAEPAKKEEPKKDDKKKKENEQISEMMMKAYNPWLTHYYHHVQSVEENPNACVIV